MSGFTHLHLHSEFSLLDGACRIPKLVSAAKSMGQNSIAITDHGVMYGAVEFFDACKKEGIKPIIGCEVYVAQRSRHDKVRGIDSEYTHLVLLCKNEQGYRNLIKMISLSNTEGFYYKPRVDMELLREYHEGLIALSACLAGAVPKALSADNYGKAVNIAKEFNSIFGEGNYYIELQNHGYDEQLYILPMLKRLANETGIPLVATNDVHFVDEDQAEAHDHLICVSTNHFIDDPDRMRYTKQEWLKSPEEMADIFSDIPEALTNTQEIVDKVEVYDIDSGPLMPKFPIPVDFGTEEQYRERFTHDDLYNEFTRDENGNEIMTREEGEKKIKNLGGYDKLYRIKLIMEDNDCYHGSHSTEYKLQITKMSPELVSVLADLYNIKNHTQFNIDNNGKLKSHNVDIYRYLLNDNFEDSKF